MDKGSNSASPWEYVDFDLEINEESATRSYPVTARSPEGEAQAQMRFPFDEWELRDSLRDIENALLRSGGKRRRIGTPEEQAVQGFGRALFEALLVGDVGAHYRMSLREARRQNKGLRLKLHVRPAELSTLPWEFVYDPQRDYLCLSSMTPLVRYPNVPQPIEQLTIAPPLRILGMVASPRGLPQLEVGHEKRLMEEAVKGLRSRGLVQLSWLEGQSWRDLQRAMRQGPWHVFHFIGHGGFDPETEEGAIALADEEGRTQLLGATALARLLDDHYPLRLVFLNSCEGARGSPRDAFSSVAATLVRSGAPAVVAMQYEITDTAAIEFSRSFYEAVADELPVDAAVAEARTAISMASDLEWGTPVLYMRSSDGHIFDISESQQQDAQRQTAQERYRKAVGEVWADNHVSDADAEQLSALSSELDLAAETAADIERGVMGGTIETILGRQEEAARGEWQTQKVDELYAQARRSHQDRKWQAVVDVFEQIHAEDPTYPDQEGLLTSARGALALEIAQKKEGALRQYREGVESAWADGELNRHQVETLRDLADKLEMSPSNSAKIEREVMGATKEAILENQERAAAKRRYRRAVGEAWTDNKLSKAEAEQLSTLASELGLSMDTAIHIEREVMGDTAQAILQRQIREEGQHQRHLEELYAQARRLHGDQEWEAVVDKFEQIYALESTYPDPEELLESARDALESGRKVADAYDRGRRHMDAGEWQQALERLEEVQRLAPSYREVKELLSWLRQKLARPPKVKVPDLSGKEMSQASRVLTDAGLNLNTQNKVANNAIPEEQIIEQSPQAGTEVEAGSVVSITVSSGPQNVSRRAPPDLLAELAGSWWAMALRGLVIGSFGLAELVLQDDFHFRFSYALMMIADGVIARLDATSRVDRRRPLLIQSRISILVGLLVLLVWVANLDQIYNRINEPADLFRELALALRLIGSWAIFIGIIRIIAALQLRWETKDLWIMGTSGVLLAVFGIALWLEVSPSHGTWWLLQFLLLVSGIALIAVALLIRDQYEWDSRVRHRRV